MNTPMLNAQISMLNECLNAQWSNALNIEHCSLNIASEGGVV